MAFIKKRKGDESASALSMNVIILIVVGIVLLAAFSVVYPVISKLLVPWLDAFIDCLNTGLSCPFESMFKVIGG